ncbi:MAG: hypothetical protein JWO20_1468 [Candidatus Angelobacter sp.]|jgi:hypothetical protein|nr:hypothetical protein [Candidatus Angelobacter sp.]
MSGKILVAIGIVWLAAVVLLFACMLLLSKWFGGIGIDISLPMSAMKVVLPMVLFGWIPVLAIGIYRMKRLR